LLADILRDEIKKQGKGLCQNSDGGIFCLLRLGCWLEMKGSDLPDPVPLPSDDNGEQFLHYFAGDECFLLKKYLMRPYLGRVLTDKHIFNYELSQGLLFSNTLSLCSSPNVKRPSFTSIQDHRQNYSFVHSNFYIFRQQIRKQKVLN
jgi:hypothetical protein